ncbi:unnamed protein product [Moneuplotes crassus]|uniref:Uncharacterized protein n=1 Tax=Euplotes crassus TaxID=5936 RepID=A0AAD1UFS9_EUPCR|nr:unnamed protein product [Moneuplotes crassus]
MNFGSKSPEFYPKYAHYGSDGQGRDSYILKNNGGLCNEPSRPVFESTMYSRVKPHTMGKAPLRDATSFKYISDGSGRDFYITHNSGGLEAPYFPGTRPSESHFITSLRSGNKHMGQKKMITPAERQKMKKCQSAQRLLVQRLTASSKEWREISRYNKMKSLSRERELKSPTAANQDKLLEYQTIRNETLKRPMLMYSHINGSTGMNEDGGHYLFPVQAKSTRNLNLKDKIHPLMFGNTTNTKSGMSLLKPNNNETTKRKRSMFFKRNSGYQGKPSGEDFNYKTLVSKKNSKLQQSQKSSMASRRNSLISGKLLIHKNKQQQKPSAQKYDRFNYL